MKPRDGGDKTTMASGISLNKTRIVSPGEGASWRHL